jgi:hypothetical protein
MQLIPLELKRLIVELSSGSPSSLAALARTHTSYQREAEKALYDTLYIYSSSDDSLKCLETLSTNSEKATLVRFLTIVYARDNIHKNRRLTTYLSKCLINMHSLSDFRVRSHPNEAQMMKGLSKILWSVCKILIFSKLMILLAYSEGHFRLQTLYYHDVRSISQIIKSQTELQILGLYGPGILNPRIVLKTLKELHNQLFLPIVLTLERESFITVVDHISIFPTFYSVDRQATIPQGLVQSFCEDQGNYMVAKAENIIQLSIYLVDSSGIPSIYALAKDMAVSFPGIHGLNLLFERRCEIVSFLLTVDDYNCT